MASDEFSFKLIVMGDTCVGKTSLVNRFCYSKFDDRVPMTVGVAGVTMNMVIRGQPVELKIWDTAGQEQYSALIPMFSRGSNACVLVADVMNSASIDNLRKWHEILLETTSDTPVVIALNKMDLLPSITDGVKIVDKVLESFSKVMLVSAKSGEGVEGMFRLAATMALDSRTKSPDRLQIGSKNDDKCC